MSFALRSRLLKALKRAVHSFLNWKRESTALSQQMDIHQEVSRHYSPETSLMCGEWSRSSRAPSYWEDHPVASRSETESK